MSPQVEKRCAPKRATIAEPAASATPTPPMTSNPTPPATASADEPDAGAGRVEAHAHARTTSTAGELGELGELGERAPSATRSRDETAPLSYNTAAPVAEAQAYSRHSWLVLDPDELQASESEATPSSTGAEGLGRSDGVLVDPPGLTW